jgi:membrane associated rhomboid family serine protease
MKLTYNAPFILSYTLLCALIRGLGDVIPGFMGIFTVGIQIDFGNPIDYFRLFSHAMGHADWEHFFGNFSFILIIGPILEEKYGSKKLLLMAFITALVTGMLNVMFFSTALLGASGVLFMLILLASFTNMKKGVVPLTFVLVLVVYLGGEVYNAFSNDNVSQFAHIIGGVFGGIFGFVMGTEPPASTTKGNSESRNEEDSYTELFK